MSAEVADSASAPGKLDPETLELRGRPPRVVRFRKKVIIGLVALGSAAMVGIAWMALGPAEPGLSVRPRYEGEVAAVAPPDALADAPRSYDDMPELGPPLPGDLGRAIVARQRGEALDAQGGLAPEGARASGGGAEVGEGVGADGAALGRGRNSSRGHRGGD